MNNPPQVAIIVPTYNEERNIGQLLESIKAQTVACEVAVVDQESTDRTVDIARAHGGDLKLEDSTMGGLRAVVQIPV